MSLIQKAAKQFKDKKERTFLTSMRFEVFMKVDLYCDLPCPYIV
jgi:hypothetical protein